MLRVARSGAVKAKTAAMNTLRAMLVTAPDSLRTQLHGLPPTQLVTACARLRPDLLNLADPIQASKAALRSLAIRIQHLEIETRTLRKELDKLTEQVAPTTSAVFGLGPDTVSHCSSPSATTPTGFAAKPRSPTSAVSRRSPPHPGRRTATGCTAAATGPETAPCTSPPSCDCAMTHAAAPTPTDAPPRAYPCPKSSAAKSATWPAKSSRPSAPTSQKLALDITSGRSRRAHFCSRRSPTPRGHCRSYHQPFRSR